MTFFKRLKCLFLIMLFFASSSSGILSVNAEDSPDLNSTFAYVIDLDTDQVLYEKNADQQMYPASLTKMMTEIVSIESLSNQLDKKITITSDMIAGLAEANASVAGFSVSDSPTVLDLLYGCALPSGAECAQALAITTDGSISSFVQHMNEKALELGMTHSHFTNPTGLQDNDHFSTAHDLSILLQYCLSNDIFQKIFCTKEYISSPVLSHPEGLVMKSTAWASADLSDKEIPGFQGGKTGYTISAGRCLASYAEINGMEIISVTGHAQDTKAITDAYTIYTWLSGSFQRSNLLTYGKILTSIPVLDGKRTDSIDAEISEDFDYDTEYNAAISIETDLPDYIEAPVEAGDRVGTVRVNINGTIIHEAALASSSTVAFSPLKHFARLFLTVFRRWGFLLVLAILLLFLAFSIRHRSKKKMHRKRKPVSPGNEH